MTTEDIQLLIDLLTPLHIRLDEEFAVEPIERYRMVIVTAQQERDLTQAVMILWDRLKTAKREIR
jgi:hypothetical protein